MLSCPLTELQPSRVRDHSESCMCFSFSYNNKKYSQCQSKSGELFSKDCDIREYNSPHIGNVLRITGRDDNSSLSPPSIRPVVGSNMQIEPFRRKP